MTIDDTEIPVRFGHDVSTVPAVLRDLKPTTEPSMGPDGPSTGNAEQHVVA